MNESDVLVLEDDELMTLWMQVGRNLDGERILALERGAEPQGAQEKRLVEVFDEVKSRGLLPV